MLAAFDPIAMAGALVLPDGMKGMIEQSITLSPSTPRTRNLPSTTDIGSLCGPILKLPEGW